MEVNGSHRSLQHQISQQQAASQRIPNGGGAGAAGRDHWSKLPEPHNGHDPQVNITHIINIWPISEYIQFNTAITIQR